MAALAPLGIEANRHAALSSDLPDSPDEFVPGHGAYHRTLVSDSPTLVFGLFHPKFRTAPAFANSVGDMLSGEAARR